MSEACVILFEDGTPKDWRRAAEILDRASVSLTLGDATKVCRLGHGLVHIPLPADEAHAAAIALSAAGFPARALPAAEVIRPPQAFVVPNADALPDGFHIQVDQKGSLQVLPWESVRLIHVDCVRPRGGTGATGASTQTTLAPRTALGDGEAMLARGMTLKKWEVGPFVFESMHSVVTGPDTGSTAPAAAPKLSEPEVWLEVCTLSPPVRMRIKMHAFNYDYLARRLTASSRANFRLLVGDLLTFAPRALMGGRIKEALAGRGVDDPAAAVHEPEHELAVSALLTRVAVLGNA